MLLFLVQNQWLPFGSLSFRFVYFTYHIPDCVDSSGEGADDWRDSTAAHCGCGGVWSLRALLPQNGWAECQAGRCVCLFLCVSRTPAHLHPVPSNPPTQSQLTSHSEPGPNPRILQSSPGHKVPFCPLSPPPLNTTSPTHTSRPLLHSISTASSLYGPITTSSTLSFAWPATVIVLGRREVTHSVALFL